MERSFLNKALDGNIPATQRMLRIMLNNDKIKVRNLMLRFSEMMKVRRQKEHVSIAERWICTSLIQEKSTRLYQRPM